MVKTGPRPAADGPAAARKGPWRPCGRVGAHKGPPTALRGFAKNETGTFAQRLGSS